MIYVAGTIAAVLSTILRGIVLQQLWLWFIVPQFHATPLRFWVALGISTMAVLLDGSTPPKPEDTPENAYLLIRSILVSLIALASGYIYSRFM